MGKPEGAEGPVMNTGMLVRRGPEEVFEAFVNPDVTTRFWFTKSSGRLVPGERVRWEWEMYGVGTTVQVMAVEPHRRILIAWGDEGEETEVEWRFLPMEDGSTFVEIENSGFSGSERELIGKVADSTGGFTLVLAGLKALLEHDIELNLVADRHPPGLG